MKIGYARVSTKDQSFDLQNDALKKAGCKKIYKQVITGARTQSKVLDELIRERTSGLSDVFNQYVVVGGSVYESESVA